MCCFDRTIAYPFSAEEFLNGIKQREILSWHRRGKYLIAELTSVLEEDKEQTKRQGDKGTRGQGDKGTRRQGDKETRGQGDKETRGQGDNVENSLHSSDSLPPSPHPPPLPLLFLGRSSKNDWSIIMVASRSAFAEAHAGEAILW